MMSDEKEKVPNYMTWEEYRRDIQYLKEDVRSLRKKIRLLVRILVDKKIVGAELAKSVEETAKKDEILKWFLEEAQKETPKYKIQKVKGKFAVMMATGKKFPPWKIIKSFPTKPEAQAHIDKLTKKD